MVFGGDDIDWKLGHLVPQLLLVGVHVLPHVSAVSRAPAADVTVVGADVGVFAHDVFRYDLVCCACEV